MTQLENLYHAIKTFEENGIKLSEDILRQTNELEEDIIKKDILPMLTKTIEPALLPIQRKLVLVVDYVPNEPISVRISRKRIFSNQIDAKEILPDPIVTHSQYTKISSKIKNSRTRIRITFSDGFMIEEPIAAESFVKFVKKIGVLNVRNLGIIRCKIPLISNMKDKKYGSCQKDLGNGWFLNTNTSTERKKTDIEYIAKKLNVNVKVEII